MSRFRRKSRDATPEHISKVLKQDSSARAFANRIANRVTGRTAEQVERLYAERRLKAVRTGALSAKRLYMRVDARMDKIITFLDIPDHALDTVVVQLAHNCRLPDDIYDQVEDGYLERIYANNDMRERIRGMLEENRRGRALEMLPDFVLARRFSPRYIAEIIEAGEAHSIKPPDTQQQQQQQHDRD